MPVVIGSYCRYKVRGLRVRGREQKLIKLDRQANRGYVCVSVRVIMEERRCSESRELNLRGSLGVKYPFANGVGVLANVLPKI